jgi:adenylyltransferase/sulfurtransferase
LHETCDTAGIIGPAIAWTAAVQVAEALKTLVGRVEDLHGSLLAHDVWKNRFQQLKPTIDPACPTCGVRRFAHLEGSGRAYVTLCGRDSVQIHQRQPRKLDLNALQARLAQFGPVRANNYLLKCLLDPYELTVFPDGRAIVKGTKDPAVARGLYAKYIGA